MTWHLLFCPAEIDPTFSPVLLMLTLDNRLGLAIPEGAIEQMKEHLIITDEDLKIAAVEEKKRRHDVMAHVHAFGQVAPVCHCMIAGGLSYLRDHKSLNHPLHFYL
jgi:adenylosuccinate lyase